MKFRFEAKIDKVGINPCVKVPTRITRLMIPEKGYIPIKGKIEKYNFRQTLVPVRDAIHFAVWLAGFVSNRVKWGGVEYAIESGKMREVSVPKK